MEINDTPVYIGTSGYKHDDWHGAVYPGSMQNEEYLNYYSGEFGLNFVELTFPFYAVPERETVEHIAQNAAGRVSFAVRLYKDFLKGHFGEQEKFMEGFAPLLEAGLIKGWLADYHYNFEASRQNFDKIKMLRDHFGDLPLFCEFPHRTWHKEKYTEEFRDERIGVVVTDMPNNPKFPPMKVVGTNGYSYFRLHGRNPDWKEPRSIDLNYSYKKHELENILMSVENIASVTREVFVSFCNIKKGRGAFNAKYMKEMIDGTRSRV
ncbi:DUF72 domain-containing protein [Limisalsivibrio acetivorans]|uniref:DUF72 domain-containing protein n=1 Tax=Limisalsivibrio acetivorans TaxID=1304888 RepID=UPI0003B79878|nr:DUF72 domain-containing protein [Limisalsivibrio acetivorans]